MIFYPIEGTGPIFTINTDNGISNEYRGDRLVRSQISIYNDALKRYVSVYKAKVALPEYGIAKDETLHGYTTVDIQSPTLVNNLVVNNENFDNSTGWIAPDGSDLLFQLYPPYTSSSDPLTYAAKSYLRFPAETYYNKGATESSSYIPDGFQPGEFYLLRVKMREDLDDASYTNTGLTFRVCERDSSGEPIADSDYFVLDSTLTTADNSLLILYKCTKAVTRSELYSKKVSFFFTFSEQRWLEKAQFFRYVWVGGQFIEPDQMDYPQELTPITKLFRPQIVTNPEDILYAYTGYDDSVRENFAPVYDPQNEKVRSIEGKNSNRFNLLQTLSETFECWIHFNIDHDSTGRVIYDNGVPRKTVTIKKDIGQQTGLGFIYGIDLKTIKRTVQSDEIVTKTIVGANKNEFGEDGFCTIARSSENFPQDTFILNFDYYINQGLLNGGEVNKDLYLTGSDSIGYYPNLRTLNQQYDSITSVLTVQYNERLLQEGYKQVYEELTSSIQEQIQALESQIMTLAGVDTIAAAHDYILANPDNLEVSTRLNVWQNLKNQKAAYTATLLSLTTSLVNLNTSIEENETTQDSIISQLRSLHFSFYKKYSRYIQEGSWISEEYIDDTLYFLDALAIAYKSSRPQVEYNISVARISSIEGFENKIFRLGDISYVQDTEFFGYIFVDGIKTPYKEKILLSEVTSYFDEPQNDTFKVQNYKTQFDDLFQRITAATQQLKFSEGGYGRAANIVEPDGTINVETLQNSILRNADIVYSAQNEAVYQDATGLTVSDTTDPSRKTKVTSGGIFITTDGGVTWKNAVRGEGIATQYLTAGNINTNLITLFDGAFPAFRWDSSGLTAYYNNGPQHGINLSKFVRFDHYGIYGINNQSGETYKPASENDIWDDARFGMTWRGFFMKNSDASGQVEVSTENDIQVVDANGTARVKIGRLGTYYGMRLKDSSGVTSLETDDSGALWLRDKLSIQSTTHSIQLGHLAEVKPETSVHEVFNANSKFIVYEDGSVKATDGEFEGSVVATSGRIGNVLISTIDSALPPLSTALDSAKIILDGQGLTVKDGGIRILDSDNNPILSYSPDQNSLVVKGSGEFSGTINASSGSFTGSVTATNLISNNGEIGGFVLTGEGLYSKAGSIGQNFENSKIKLLGNTGRIEVDEILLGIGAQIKQYIKLGSAYLFNPDIEQHNGKILEAGAITFYEDGRLKLGDINIDGATSQIYTPSFSLTPDVATFHNIVATGKISTAIFEKDSVQAVGGAMIFRPSYKVENLVAQTLTLDKAFDGQVNNYVALINENGAIVSGTYKIATITGNTIKLNNTPQTSLDIVSLVDLGDGTENIIGINSTAAQIGSLRPNGLSMTRPGQAPELFLGNLETANLGLPSSVKGYGLYADNVFLKGSLTTQLSAQSYAGVNTLNGASAIKFGSDDQSKIVFWAGSSSPSITDIQQAPFQVTEKGSLYAHKGLFEDSVFARASIEASDIYAARIHGTGQNAALPYGLAFFNTDYGLVFKAGGDNDTDAHEVFRIGSNGLMTGSSSFISVQNGEVTMKGKTSQFNEIFTTGGSLGQLRISEAKIQSVKAQGGATTIQSNLKLESAKVALGLQDKDDIVITTDLVSFETSQVKFKEKVLFADKMEYRKVENGYDLYVF